MFKVRNALDAAADAQGKPRVKDDDEQLGAVVKRLVAARKDMALKVEQRQLHRTLTPSTKLRMMKRVAKKNRELEMTVGFDHGVGGKRTKVSLTKVWRGPHGRFLVDACV